MILDKRILTVIRSGARYFTNMSVIACNKDGWILDSLKASRPCLKMGSLHYNQCKLDQMPLYQLNSDLFKIQTPFRKDTEFQKLKSIESQTELVENRKRKRKRKEPLNIGEQQLKEYHDKIKDYLHQAYSSLVDLGRQEGHFLAMSSSLPEDNNETSRRAADKLGTDDWMVDVCGEPEIGRHAVQKKPIVPGASLNPGELVQTVWQHKGDHSLTVSVNQNCYIIPPRCSFLMSDFNSFKKTHTALGKFDLMVMDPPWTNQSVKRKKKYWTLHNDELLELPMEDLMLPGCLVVVWVTNKLKNIDFVTQQLFPSNHIDHVASWYWLKVTMDGQCVVDMESLHKKPYETIVIGRYAGPADAKPSQSRHSSHEHCTDTNTKSFTDHTPMSETCDNADVVNEDSNTHRRVFVCEETSSVCSHPDEAIASALTSEIENNETKHHSNHVYVNNATSGISNAINNCSCNNPDSLNNKAPILNQLDQQYRGYRTEGEKNVGKVVYVNEYGCESDRSGPQKPPVIPDNKVIVSIPCSLHSRKPVLYEVLREYLPPEARCLEMFARNLVPGWSSWGNEVLLHQHVDLFEPVN